MQQYSDSALPQMYSTSNRNARFETSYHFPDHEDFPESNHFRTNNPMVLSYGFSNPQIQNRPEHSPPPPYLESQRIHYAGISDSDSPSEQQVFHQALAFTNGTPPQSIAVSALTPPVAIPQVIPGRGQPFARAWAPSLASHRITKTDFLAFIDGLNIVSTANPPLQVLNLAGGVIGMVPYHWAAIAGLAIQATARLGTAAVSKGRTEIYMKEVNERFFAPRKLKVAIASRDAVAQVARLPGNTPVLAPLTRETMNMRLNERSLETMRGYIAELDFDVPPVAEQTTILAKMSAKQIERQGKKNERKTLKERQKVLEKEEKERPKILGVQNREGRGRTSSDSNSEVWNPGPKSKKELKRERSREKKSRKEAKKEEKKHGKKEKEKESEKARKLLWILIESL